MVRGAFSPWRKGHRSSRVSACLSAPNQLSQGIQVFLMQFTFPDCVYRPSEFDELTLSFAIAGRVAVELFTPEDSVSLWTRGLLTPRVLVPETPVHKHHGFELWKHNVW